MSEFHKEILQTLASSYGFKVVRLCNDWSKCGFLYDILHNDEEIGSIKVWFQTGEFAPRIPEISFMAKKEIFQECYSRSFNTDMQYICCIHELFGELSVLLKGRQL
jgi:hypothetical protein